MVQSKEDGVSTRLCYDKCSCSVERVQGNLQRKESLASHFLHENTTDVTLKECKSDLKCQNKVSASNPTNLTPDK